MAKNLWDFRRKLFKRAYEQGFIDFPIREKIRYSDPLGITESRVKWKNLDHKLMYDKISLYLDDFWKLYNQKKLTVAQVIDIISTRRTMELDKILERFKKPKKHLGTPPKPEKKGYKYHWVITSRDKKSRPLTGYWRGKKI